MPVYPGARKLKLADAALLCLRHHRRFDHDGWELHIEGTTVTSTAPTRPTSPDGPDGPDGHPTTPAATTRQTAPRTTATPETLATVDEPVGPTGNPTGPAATTRQATLTENPPDREPHPRRTCQGTTAGLATARGR